MKIVFVAAIPNNHLCLDQVEATPYFSPSQPIITQLKPKPGGHLFAITIDRDGVIIKPFVGMAESVMMSHLSFDVMLDVLLTEKRQAIYATPVSDQVIYNTMIDSDSLVLSQRGESTIYSPVSHHQVSGFMTTLGAYNEKRGIKTVCESKHAIIEMVRWIFINSSFNQAKFDDDVPDNLLSLI